MIIMGCNCTKFNSTCWLCVAVKRAKRKGARAYRQGRSRHSCPTISPGLAYWWLYGWKTERAKNPRARKDSL